MTGEMNLYLLKGDIKPPSWQIRQRDVYIETENGLKQIQFVPGSNSIFKEESKDQGKIQHIWIENGSIAVSKSDKLKNEFIKIHPDYGKKFYLYDPESEVREEYEYLELVEEAKALLRDADDDKLCAISAMIYGYSNLTLDPKKNKIKLFDYAEEDPQGLIERMDDPNSEAKITGALALKKGVLKLNEYRTEVQWADGGVIVTVPQGKNPLDRLTEFLANENNIVTLQEIGIKMGVSADKIKSPQPPKKTGRPGRPKSK